MRSRSGRLVEIDAGSRELSKTGERSQLAICQDWKNRHASTKIIGYQQETMVLVSTGIARGSSVSGLVVEKGECPIPGMDGEGTRNPPILPHKLINFIGNIQAMVGKINGQERGVKGLAGGSDQR